MSDIRTLSFVSSVLCRVHAATLYGEQIEFTAHRTNPPEPFEDILKDYPSGHIIASEMFTPTEAMKLMEFIRGDQEFELYIDMDTLTRVAGATRKIRGSNYMEAAAFLKNYNSRYIIAKDDLFPFPVIGYIVGSPTEPDQNPEVLGDD